jgi:hypothetical protein
MVTEYNFSLFIFHTQIYDTPYYIKYLKLNDFKSITNIRCSSNSFQHNQNTTLTSHE